jgi:hypothetical protein
MAYIGLAGQGNPATGQQGQVRSQSDPGYTNVGGQLQSQFSQQPDPNAWFSQWQQQVGNPSQMLEQAQWNQLQGQIGLTGMQSDLASQIQNQQAGWQLQGFGLDQQSQAVQQGALSRQMSLLPQQYGLQQQGFDIQGQQLGVQGQRLDEQQKESWQNAAQSQRGLKSSATAAGTWNMPGTSQGYADIKQGLQNALTNIGFGRQDLSLNQQQLGLNRQGAALTFKEQQAAQQDSQKMLGIQAQRLGLSEDEVRGRLQNALNQIGIGSQISVDQLLAEQYKVQQGGLSPLSGAFGDLLSMGGVTVPSQ